jgi:lipopolysaccharide biosynthesis glycosyltransferase
MILVFTIDNSFAQHLAVVLASVKANCSGDIYVHIISDYLTDENQLALHHTVAKSNMKLTFHQDDSLTSIDVVTQGHFAKANFYRLYMTQFLDDSVDKVIYLDSDLLVLKDLRELWQTSIENFSLAAVETPEPDQQAALGIKNYYNSGVMIINVNYWRKNNVMELFNKTINDHKSVLKYCDQDVLNIAFHNNILNLSSVWNHSVKEFTRQTRILHFMGVHKPWSKHYSRNFGKKLYYRYLMLTPYFRIEWWKNMKEFILS